MDESTRIVIPYAPRAAFMPFHQRSQRWAVMVCHRRAGKTVACINNLLRSALTTTKQEWRGAYVAPFYSQAKDVAWTYLRRFAGVVPGVKFHESELYAEFPNGARIRLYGADNAHVRLRGIYLDDVILDEYADHAPGIWGEVIRPLLADRLGRATFIGTPKGRNSFYKLVNDAVNDPNWYRLILKASESGIISETELYAARSQMTEDQYAQEFECSFEATIAGAVYGKWLEKATQAGRITQVDADASLPVHTAWDLGFGDSTVIWWFQLVGGPRPEVRVIDHYEAHGHDITHYCDVLKDRAYKYGDGRHYVPHDAANKLLASGGRSIVQLAWEQGVKMTVVGATSQENQISAARKTLECAWFDADRCANGIEALRSYQFEFDDRLKTFKPRPRHDWSSHSADAFEIIGQVWQPPKPPVTETKPRFLHEMKASEIFWPEESGLQTRERI
jgi:phage terminase large subunit